VRTFPHTVAAAAQPLLAQPPEAAAAVMATGALSTCFQLTGPRWLSGALLVAAVLMWLPLLFGFLAQMVLTPARFASRTGAPASLALVAATAVLGARMVPLGRYGIAQGLWCVGVLLWLGLLPSVLRHWRTPTTGSAFLACVSTQALAVLAAQLAPRTAQLWEAVFALAVFACGLALYAVAASRFDLRLIARGAGDQWVSGGALAISALAGASLLNASRAHQLLGPAHPVLLTATWVLWWAAIAVYAPLAVSELVWLRAYFDIKRWSTAFPVAMVALASLAMAQPLHSATLRTTGDVLSWVALAVWLAVTIGALRRLVTPRAPTGAATAGHSNADSRSRRLPRA
jgi:hypothetical protein